MSKLKQWGFNPDYPDPAETWKPGEKVPEWLSDNAKVAGFNSDGSIMLDTYTDKEGKVHIRDTYRPIDLVVIPMEHLLVYGNGLMKVISPEQLEFLYETPEEE